MSESKPLIPKGGIGRRIRAYFLTGLLVVVPLGLTYFIIKLLFLAIDDILSDTVSSFILQQFGVRLGERQIPGIGIITLLLIILITGILARNYFGRKLVNLGDRAVERIPLINRVYSATKQLSQAFFSSKREVFKKPVLFEYPRKGIYSIGFYTQDTRGAPQEALEQDVVSVFLPTTPNPTSGYLLFVPKTDVYDLDLTIEEALKLVISGGAIVPLKSTNNRKTLDESSKTDA
ncbi:DUF502 domain-containing protein [bacterium]|nr:DUF502 domain-containing protein [bacterium]